MQEIPAPREGLRSPEKSLQKRLPPSALWVASGILGEHAGKKHIEDVDSAANSLATRKKEDLIEHHQKVSSFSTQQREMHWQERESSDPKLHHPDEQIMQWQDGVIDYIAALQKQGHYDSLQTVLETIHMNDEDMQDHEAFPSIVRQRVEDFRQEFLEGPAKIEEFAEYFTQGRSLEDNLKALENAQGFLGVFGGKETVQLVKDAIIAHAYIDSLSGDRKDELLTTAKDVLSQELSDETASLYGQLYQQEVGMQPGEEMSLTPPLTENEEGIEPAPLETSEDQSGLGSTTERSLQTTSAGEDGDVPAAEEAEKEKNITFAELQQALIEREMSKFPELRAWFEQEAAKMPEMRVETDGVGMTNGKDWSAQFIRGENGEVEGVSSIDNANKFFTLKGIKVFKDGKETHTQPGLFEDTQEIEIDTAYGKVKMETSAFVGVIKDKHGNVLVGLGQEPLADTPNHVIVKDPLQTSIGKFKLVMGDPEKGTPGDPNRDRAFYDTLRLAFPGEDTVTAFYEHLKKPDTIWGMGAVNGNRLHSPNIAFEIVIDDDRKDAMTADGKNRWVTEDERKALERSGLLNLIGTGAFTAV